MLTLDEQLLRASFRRPGSDIDCYRIWSDGPVLRVDAGGVWNMAVAELYAADITRVVAEQRATRPPLRAIVDQRVVPEFDAGVQEMLLAVYADLLVEGDRIAMVVGSSLAKGRIRRITCGQSTQSFLSIAAARMWVLAYG